MPSPLTRLTPLRHLTGWARPRVAAPSAAALALLLGLVSTVGTVLYLWCLSPHALTADEAHYWDWSRNLDLSYYSKGPLVAWLIRGSCELFGAASVALTGDLTAAVRLPAALCHGVLLAAWYLLAARAFGSPALGLATVAATASLPLVRAGAVVTTIDPPFLVCWAWALVCVLRAVETGRTQWWAAAAALCGVGVLAKYTMVLFPAAVGAFLLFHRRSEFRRPGVWLLVAGTALGWVPVLVWNAGHDWVTFRHVFGQVGVRKENAGSGVPGFLVGQLGVLFVYWLCAFAAAGWRFRPGRDTAPAVALLWWASAPVWLFFLVASVVKSGQANWPAPSYIGGLVLSVAWVREQLAARPWAAAICLGLATVLALALTAAQHFPGPVRPVMAALAGPPTETNPYPVRRLDMTARMTGWRELAGEIDATRARVRAETGAEPVLAGTHWTLPGELGFYCAGHPRAYTIGIANRSDRYSQYDLWRPNPVADAQEFRGRAFVIVGDIGAEVAAAFERVEPPTRVVVAPSGIPVAGWAVRVCYGFRGFARVAPAPGSLY